MKIHFHQSGGWGNPLGKSVELDTGQLAPEDADILQRLFDEAQLRGPLESLSPAARDAVQYEITIEMDAISLEVRVDDVSAPANLRPLIRFLQERARPGRTGNADNA